MPPDPQDNKNDVGNNNFSPESNTEKSREESKTYENIKAIATQSNFAEADFLIKQNQTTNNKVEKTLKAGKDRALSIKEQNEKGQEGDGATSFRKPKNNIEPVKKLEPKAARDYQSAPSETSYSSEPLQQQAAEKYNASVVGVLNKPARSEDSVIPERKSNQPNANQFKRVHLDPEKVKKLGQNAPAANDDLKQEEKQAKGEAGGAGSSQDNQAVERQTSEQPSVEQQRIAQQKNERQKAVNQEINEGGSQHTNGQAKYAENAGQRTSSSTNRDRPQQTENAGQSSNPNSNVLARDANKAKPQTNYYKGTVSQGEQSEIVNKQYVKSGNQEGAEGGDPFTQSTSKRGVGTGNDGTKNTSGTAKTSEHQLKEHSNKSNLTGEGQYGKSENKAATDATKQGTGNSPKEGSITKYDPKGNIEAENQAQTEKLDNKESRLQPKEPKHTTQDEKGDTRPGEIIDKRRDPRKFETEKGGKKFGETDTKSGSKLDVRIDGKGKRIGLDGKEILVWDGKNSPLYPNQKGKRVTRFVDQGKKIKIGKDGKIKYGDQKTDLTPAEKAHIDKVIKETDRIFFGEKKPKGKLTSKGEQKAGSTGKSDVRSGKNTTKVSKGDTTAVRSDSTGKGDTTKPAKGKFGGLPDYAPFPGLKLPEFKIRWPNWKPNKSDAGTKQTDSKTGKGNRGTKFDGVQKPDRVKGAESIKSTDKASSKIDTKKALKNIDSNIRSVNKNVGKLLPEQGAKAKLVRSFPTRSEIPKGVEATQYKPLTLKPSKISVGTRAQSDATFIPSSVLIQPIDWSALRGWLEIRGIFKTGKGRRGSDKRIPGKSSTGDTKAVKDATTKSSTGTVVSDSRKQSGKSASDAASKKESQQEKAKSNLDSRLVDSKGKKAKAKGADQKFEMKESGDAFGGKLPSIKMTTKPDTGSVKPFDGSKVKADGKIDAQGQETETQKAKELSNQIQKDLKPINTGKAGVLKFEHTSARSGKEVPTDQKIMDGETATSKSTKSDSSKSKQAQDKAKINVEGKDGRAILKELALSKGLKGWISKRNNKLLDGARVIRGAHLVALDFEVGKAKTRSIHEILAGTKLRKPKRNFTPEITESGSYKVARNMSSGQILALGSSSRHPAINFDSTVAEGKVTRGWDLQEDKEDENLYKRKTKPSSEEKARKTYTVKEGDTPELIAVVELSNADLAPLICEINKPAFVPMYDSYKEEHVDTLLPGTMILLPNKSDIEEFKK